MSTTSEQTASKEVIATVRKLRKAIGDTQQAFASRLGVAIMTVIRYQRDRPPKGKALAQLEQIAAAHGLNDYAAVFRRALSEELGARPPSPTGPTIYLKDDEEKEIALALLHVLRVKGCARRAKAIKRILEPVVVQRREDAEFREAMEASSKAVVRLLKGGHSPKEVQKKLGMFPENIAHAFFDYGGPDLIGDRFNDMVGFLLNEGWSIEGIADDFCGGDADEVLGAASELGDHHAVQDYEDSQAEKQQDASKPN